MRFYIITCDSGSKYRFQADDIRHAVEQAEDYLQDLDEAPIKVEMDFSIEDVTWET